MENIQTIAKHEQPHLNTEASSSIPYFIPDLPTSDEVYGILKSIDSNKWYSNFGPLEQSLRLPFMQTFFQSDNELEVTFTNTGTAAINLALKALELPQASKVLVPSLSFPATAIAVINAGLEPIFADVGNELELSVKQTMEIVQKHNIKAVVPVLFHNQSKELKKWDIFAKETNIPVVIDSCAALDVMQLPTYCTMTFSLHATKFYGIGEGGAVVSKNTDLVEKVRKFSNFGFDHHKIIGIGDNAKLSEYHAAVAHSQLSRVVMIRYRKQELTEHYQNAFERCPHNIQVMSRFNEIPSYLLITSLNCNVKSLHRYLLDEGIENRRFHYPLLIDQPAFKRFECISSPETISLISKNLISLPFHNHIQKQDIEEIVDCIIAFTELKELKTAHN